MRQIVIILSFILLSVTVACGEDDMSSEVSENTETETEKTETEEQTDSEKNLTEDKDSSDEASDDSTSSAKKVLQNAADAMKAVTGMKLKGASETESESMGVQDQETSQMTGKTTFDPYSHHMKIDNQSDQEGESEMEMYWTNETTYIWDSEDDDWISMSVDQSGDTMNAVPAAITETQYDFFVDHHEMFELTEDDAHYILTFSGSGEEYIELMYSSLKDIADEETYQNVTDMISDVSGTFEMKVDKKTDYVVAIQMDVEQTNNLGGMEINSIDSTSYEYSDFNEVEEVIVPDDVVENAQELNMDMMPEVE